jgi:hypothetical protein
VAEEEPVSSRFVADTKCRTRLLAWAGVALALTAALAAAGCTSTPATATGAGTQAGSTTPEVTTAQAGQVFASYVTVADRAASTGDASLALSKVTGIQKLAITTQLKAAAFGTGALAKYRYGTPAFVLPQQDGYPRWFVASVTRSLIGQQGSPGGTAGLSLAATGQVLMVFQQGSATAPWLLSSISQLPAGASVPPLATDSAGYVATVPLSSAAQLARPDSTGALQAAVVDDGPASPATKVVAAGNLTTGIYAAARAALTAPPGDVYIWELEGTHYSNFALRTADGGALVFYGMYLVSAVEVPSILNKGVVSPGAPITVPGYLAFLLTPKKSAPRLRLGTEQLLSFAAVDPPASGATAAKIQVIGIGGGLIYASAS